MADEKIKVPGSSLQELKKIIMGYVDLEKDVTLDSISKRTGIGRTTISSNNPFLTQVDLLSGGTKKNPTDLCVSLGRSIQHNQKQDEEKFWGKLVTNSEFLAGLISTVRLRQDMTEEDLANHVLYAGGLKKTKQTKTGANTIVEILKESKLIVADQSTGKLSVASGNIDSEENNEGFLIKNDEKPAESPTNQENNDRTGGTNENVTIKTQYIGNSPTVAINIELKIPPTENPVVYENLFSALRKNLLEPIDDENKE